MKRIAFCDGIMPDLYLGHTGAYNQEPLSRELGDRMYENINTIKSLEEKYDVVKYTQINPKRIKKDYLDALITYVNEDSKLYPASFEDIRTAKFENPDMNVIIYTERKPELDYFCFSNKGIDNVLWRNSEIYDRQLRILLKWVDTLEEIK